MSGFSRRRKQRLRDFERRANFTDDLRTYRSWQYITVHPFADEPELLARLGLHPEDCQKADVWWHTGEDVVLLQTVAVGEEKPTTCSWFGDEPYLSIIARLPDKVTTIESLHHAMGRINSCGLPKRPRTSSRRSMTIFHW